MYVCTKNFTSKKEVKKLNILVDYLTVSIPYNNISFDDLKRLCHLDGQELKEISSYLGYGTCLFFNSIKLHTDGLKGYHIIDMSGVGCRTLETLSNMKLNWIEFITVLVADYEGHISRIDIAGDDKEELLSMKTMFDSVKNKKYICLSKKEIRIQGDEENIIFGSSSSDRRLRIYNKALERKTEGHWIRAEFQLRDDAAMSFYYNMMMYQDIGRVYRGMLHDYLRFTTKPNNSNHTERLTTCKWWLKFLDTAEKIKGIYIGGIEYNLMTLEHYLFAQVAPSLDTYIMAKEGDLTELLDIARQAKKSRKQEDLLRSLGITVTQQPPPEPPQLQQ